MSSTFKMGAVIRPVRISGDLDCAVVLDCIPVGLVVLQK